MRLISFKHTRLFKRGVWLSAAALLASAALRAAPDGRLAPPSAPGLLGLGILGAAIGYVVWRMQIHRLADAVIDHGDRLTVRRRRTEATVPASGIAGAEVATTGGIHRITLRLRARGPLGDRIVFLPQASLWSNRAAVERLARHLAERSDA